MRPDHAPYAEQEPTSACDVSPVVYEHTPNDRSDGVF